jgi:hypothetical protein
LTETTFQAFELVANRLGRAFEGSLYPQYGHDVGRHGFESVRSRRVPVAYYVQKAIRANMRLGHAIANVRPSNAEIILKARTKVADAR